MNRIRKLYIKIVEISFMLNFISLLELQTFGLLEP